LPFQLPQSAILSKFPQSILDFFFKRTKLGQIILDGRIPQSFLNASNFEKAIFSLRIQTYFHLQKSADFLHTFVRSVEEFPFTTSRPKYEKLNDENCKVTFVWGKFDKTVPYTNGELAKEIIKKSKLFLFDAGHSIVYEKEHEINSLLKTEL